MGVLDTISEVFSTIAVSGAGREAGYYKGAVAVGTTVYFGPDGYDNIGVLDTLSGTFVTISTSGGEYKGVVAVGTTLYFVPYNVNNVGVFDTVNNIFTTIALTGAAAYSDDMYNGGVAVGTMVFFAPFNMNSVGVLDTVTRIFSTIPADGGINYGVFQEYEGAAAVGSKVFFIPQYARNVGVLETCFLFDTCDTYTTKLNAFSTVSTTSSQGQHEGYTAGAVALGSAVYFVPNKVDYVGVLETYAVMPPPPPLPPPPPPSPPPSPPSPPPSPPSPPPSLTFATIATTGPDEYGYTYSGAAAVGNKVVFAPFDANNVGVLDTFTGNFITVATPGNGEHKYAGAAAVGDKVYFAYSSDNSGYGVKGNVGVFDTTSNTFTTVGRCRLNRVEIRVETARCKRLNLNTIDCFQVFLSISTYAATPRSPRRCLDMMDRTPGRWRWVPMCISRPPTRETWVCSTLPRRSSATSPKYQEKDLAKA